MIKKSEITETLLRATMKANRQYENMSGGSWLCDYGVESFMVSSLATETVKTFRTHYATGKVTIEEPVYNCKEFCCAKRKPGPRKAAMREWGRVDLALWKDGKDGEHLIGTIEAKRDWSTDQAAKDISRLRELVEEYGKLRNGKLQYAAFVTFLSTTDDSEGSKMEKLKARISKWVAENQSKYGKMRLSFAPRGQWLEIDDEIYYSSASVIEVL